MSSTVLDASELKGLKTTIAVLLIIEKGLSMASVTKGIRERNMPNVCYSNQYLAQSCSDQFTKGLADAHGHQ
jgi:hypothetical protein